MDDTAHRYFVLNKPYGMESQFKPNYPGALLGDLDFAFPPGTHAVGRLDKYSEGLLLLTTNKKITALLFQSAVPHRRTYLVQVRGTMSEESLTALRTGVTIRIKEGAWYTTPPCEAAFAPGPPPYPSPKPAAERMPTTWLYLSISEGKFRQVRKMVAAVRHRCFRLVRVAIEDLQMAQLQPGEVRELTETDFFQLLKLQPVPAAC